MEAAIYNHRTWISLTDPEPLVTTLENWMQIADFHVVNSVIHHFEPQGFTALWLLQESHLAVHTFPEHGKTYLEISSCNQGKNDHFVNLLQQSPYVLNLNPVL